MPGFVIEFNRGTGAREVREFADIASAMEARLELELHRTDSDIEIVAIGAASLDALRRTHRRYFLGDEYASA